MPPHSGALARLRIAYLGNADIGVAGDDARPHAEQYADAGAAARRFGGVLAAGEGAGGAAGEGAAEAAGPALAIRAEAKPVRSVGDAAQSAAPLNSVTNSPFSGLRVPCFSRILKTVPGATSMSETFTAT